METEAFHPDVEQLLGAIYGRQSKTIGDSESVEAQHEACLSVADRHGVAVVATLLEPPSTGAYRNRGRDRPLFPDLVAMVEAGEINTIIAYETDRLSRGGGPGWAPLLDAAEGAGLDLNRFILGPSGFLSEFEIGIRATMDREEARKISERSREHKRRTARAGKPSGGGYRPFGYSCHYSDISKCDLPEGTCPHDGTVSVIEHEAALIREAADRYLAGEGFRAIARSWNKLGLKTPTGRAWSGETIYNMMRSPRIAGYRGHLTQSLRDAKKRPSASQRRQAMTRTKAVWPEILSLDTWEAVNAKMDSFQRRGNTDRKHPFTGIVRCGICSRKMWIATDPNGHRRLTCIKRLGTPACGRVSIKAQPVIDVLTEILLDRLDTPALAAHVHGRRVVEKQETTEEALHEIRVVEERMAALARRWSTDDSFTEAEWEAARKPLAARLEAARKRLEPGDTGGALRSLAEEGINLRETWNELPMDRRRSIAQAVFDRVVISPHPRPGSRDIMLEERMSVVLKA